MRYFPRLLIAFATSLMALMLVGPTSAATAEEKTHESAEGKTWVLLSSEKSWLMAYTASSPLDAFERWEIMPVVYVSEGSKLFQKGDNPTHGPTVLDVEITDGGFTFVSPFVGRVAMIYDRADAKHPFKGVGGGYTFWLTYRQ